LAQLVSFYFRYITGKVITSKIKLKENIVSARQYAMHAERAIKSVYLSVPLFVL